MQPSEIQRIYSNRTHFSRTKKEMNERNHVCKNTIHLVRIDYFKFNSSFIEKLKNSDYQSITAEKK